MYATRADRFLVRDRIAPDASWGMSSRIGRCGAGAVKAGTRIGSRDGVVVQLTARTIVE